MPTTTAARDVVDRYFKAWTSKDFAAARRLLKDDLDFKGRSIPSIVPTTTRRQSSGSPELSRAPTFRKSSWTARMSC